MRSHLHPQSLALHIWPAVRTARGLSRTPQAAALEYAERGWRSLPLHAPVAGGCDCGRNCDSPGKHPWTAHGCKDATSDPSRIREWWHRWPAANVGLATDGWVVIDADGQRGVAAWQALASRLGLPRTLTVQTGNGLHLIYAAPPGSHIGNSPGRLPAGIHVRGSGGYIVAAPSLHPSGRRYAFVGGMREIVPAPPALIDRLQRPAPRPVSVPIRPEEPIGIAGGPLHEGQRNQRIFRIACAARAEGMDLPEILGTIERANQARCRPPLAWTEIERIGRSACRYARGRAL